MLSLLDVLLLILGVQYADASPLRQYLNTTTTSTTISTTAQNLERLPPIVTAPGPASSGDPCESMEATTTSTARTGRKGVAAFSTAANDHPSSTTSMATKHSFSGLSMPKPHNATTADSATSTAHRHNGGGIQAQGTTVSTLRTTIPPGTPTNRISATGTAHEHGKPYGGSSEGGRGGPSTTSSFVFASPPHHVAHSPAHGVTNSMTMAAGPSTTSSPAVWGTLTLTYHTPSSFSSSTLPGSETHGKGKARPTKHATKPQVEKPSSLTAQFSSTFAYPTPLPSSPPHGGSSSPVDIASLTAHKPLSHSPTLARTTLAGSTLVPQPPSTPIAPTSQTVNAAPPRRTSTTISAESTPPSSPQPQGRPGNGFPPAMPQPPPSPTSTRSAAPGGITIVPINPDATTVYVTVTTTEPGWTTTVAQETVTEGGGGWR